MRASSGSSGRSRLANRSRLVAFAPGCSLTEARPLVRVLSRVHYPYPMICKLLMRSR